MMTGSSESRSRRSRRTSMPLRSGRAKSISTRSNGRSAIRASPSWPSPAVSTSYPSSSSKVSSDSRMAASSSTISTDPAEASSSRPRAFRLTTASGIHGLSDQGEFHGEGRASSGLAVHADLAGVLLDDAVGDREPQSGAARVPGFGLVLGGEEGIVDAVYVLLGDTR